MDSNKELFWKMICMNKYVPMQMEFLLDDFNLKAEFYLLPPP